MKLLLELINTPVKRVASNQPTNKERSEERSSYGSRSPKSKQLGRGVFGSVERHQNLPPGAVVKYGRTVLNDAARDGYINYIKAITKSDRMARNPYFPRIYTIKIIDGENYTVIMEELTPFITVNMRELESLADRMFGSLQNMTTHFHPDPGLEYKPSKETKRSNQYSRLDYITRLPQILNRIIRGESPMDLITDPQLREALLIIKGVARNTHTGGHPDIHEGNVMLRRGPTGIQLVITDPMV
jgi:hypothetical protein